MPDRKQDRKQTPCAWSRLNRRISSTECPKTQGRSQQCQQRTPLGGSRTAAQEPLVALSHCGIVAFPISTPLRHGLSLSAAAHRVDDRKQTPCAWSRLNRRISSTESPKTKGRSQQCQQRTPLGGSRTAAQEPLVALSHCRIVALWHCGIPYFHTTSPRPVLSAAAHRVDRPHPRWGNCPAAPAGQLPHYHSCPSSLVSGTFQPHL